MTKRGTRLRMLRSNTNIAFLNELLQELGLYYGSGDNEKVAALAYADDLVLQCNTEAKLQQLLDILRKYGNRWRLSVNVDKTKTMAFRRPGRGSSRMVKVTYQDQHVE